jgi:hypothetical protein
MVARIEQIYKEDIQRLSERLGVSYTAATAKSYQMLHTIFTHEAGHTG